jgi:hypothetical protein
MLRLAQRPVKPTRTGGPVGGTKVGHSSGAFECSPLPGSLHSHLEDVAMRALDDAGTDRQAPLAAATGAVHHSPHQVFGNGRRV